MSELNTIGSKARPEARRIPSLDGLRALSVVGVFLAHSIFHNDTMRSFLGRWQVVGTLGVSVFFAMSGFLITRLLLAEQQTGAINLGNFYARRAIRIFPAYYAYLLFVLLLRVFGRSSTPYHSILVSALYLSNFGVDDPDMLLLHTWSLCIEEQFYLWWPLTMRLVTSRRTLVLLLGTLSLAWPFQRLLRGLPLAGASQLLPSMDIIMVGCLLAIMLEHSAWKTRLERWASHFWTCPVALSLLVAVYSVDAAPIAQPVLRVVRNVLVVWLVFWSTQNSKSGIGLFLNARAVTWVGVLSYSLYLWQEPFLTLFGPGLPFPYCVPLIVLAAYLSYVCVEKPLLGLRTKLRAYASGRNPDSIEAPQTAI